MANTTDQPTPKKTTPAKATSRPARPATFTDWGADFAAELRTFAEDTRARIDDIVKRKDDYFADAAPGPHESAVHHGSGRVVASLDDVYRALDGVIATSADMAQTAAAVTPPEKPEE